MALRRRARRTLATVRRAGAGAGACGALAADRPEPRGRAGGCRTCSTCSRCASWPVPFDAQTAVLALAVGARRRRGRGARAAGAAAGLRRRGVLRWSRSASPSGCTTTSRSGTSTTSSPTTSATCTGRSSSGSPRTASCPWRSTSPARSSSGSRRTRAAATSTWWAGSPPTAGSSCCWRASTSRSSRRSRARTGSSRSAGCARRCGAASAWTPRGCGSPSGSGSRSSRRTSPTPGVRFALVDDRHFLVTGFEREQLHAPFRTESGGKSVALFPIDERLRYLVPVQAPGRRRRPTCERLRRRRATASRSSPTTARSSAAGRARWSGCTSAAGSTASSRRWRAGGGARRAAGSAPSTRRCAETPSGGLAYLPTASYREMEAWSLPPRAAGRLRRLEHELGEARMAGPDGALVRGAHWRNFLVKYPEANRAHKKMLALSALCRARGDPPAARRAIGRAQCNDAYWHGVFGGLYLPHLRDAVWHHLAVAERELRARRGARLRGPRPRRRRLRRGVDPLGGVLGGGRAGPRRRRRGPHALRPAANHAARSPGAARRTTSPIPGAGRTEARRRTQAPSPERRSTRRPPHRRPRGPRAVRGPRRARGPRLRAVRGGRLRAAGELGADAACAAGSTAGPTRSCVRLEPEHRPESFSKEVAVRGRRPRARALPAGARGAARRRGSSRRNSPSAQPLELRVTPDAPLWRFPIETVAKSRARPGEDDAGRVVDAALARVGRGVHRRSGPSVGRRLAVRARRTSGHGRAVRGPPVVRPQGQWVTSPPMRTTVLAVLLAAHGRRPRSTPRPIRRSFAGPSACTGRCRWWTGTTTSPRTWRRPLRRQLGQRRTSRGRCRG